MTRPDPLDPPRRPVTAYTPAGVIAAAGAAMLLAAAVLIIIGAGPLGYIVTGAGVFTLGQAAGLSAARRDARNAGGAYLVCRPNDRWEVIPGTDPAPLNAHATARAIAAHLAHETGKRPAGEQAAINAARRAQRGHPDRHTGRHGLTFPSQEDPQR